MYQVMDARFVGLIFSCFITDPNLVSLLDIVCVNPFSLKDIEDIIWLHGVLYDKYFSTWEGKFHFPIGHVMFCLLYKHQYQSQLFAAKGKICYVTIAGVTFLCVKIICYCQVWKINTTFLHGKTQMTPLCNKDRHILFVSCFDFLHFPSVSQVPTIFSIWNALQMSRLPLDTPEEILDHSLFHVYFNKFSLCAFPSRLKKRTLQRTWTAMSVLKALINQNKWKIISTNEDRVNNASP